MPKEPLYNLPPKSGILTTRTVELGNTAASKSLAYNEISAQNTSARIAQEAQQKEVARLKAANDAKIDVALETAAKINLENVGALKPGTFFPLPAAKATMGPQLTAEYQLVNQEKNRSKQIITESFAQKDPISEDLDKKIGKVEDELDSLIFKKQQGPSIIGVGAEAGGGAGGFLQGFIAEKALGQDTSIDKEKELRSTLANLSQAQSTINKFKTDIQIAKATEDYLLNLKSKGQKLDQTTIKGLIDISKDIVAKQRSLTRGDELYNPTAYDTYMTQIKGNNDFFDWRHTDMSLGSTIDAVYNKIKEDPSKAQELNPVLKELQNEYKLHINSNKDAYDNYYGAQKRYLKEGVGGSTWWKSQAIGSAGEGFYNFAAPFITTTQDLLGYHKAAFQTREAKDKTWSGAVLYADLNKDQQLDERDWDIHKNYQRVGQNVTYTKKDGSIGFLGESVLGASVRTLAEMIPTLFITKGLMGAGLSARAATFVPISISSGVRSYEENKKWYKDNKNAALVGAVQGIIEGATESIVPDINYFLGNKNLATKALGANEKRYFVAQTLSPEFKNLSTSAKNFLTSSAYAAKAIASQTLQEGFEEEISMFANYFLDKTYKTKDEQFGEKPQEVDDSSILGFGKSMITTFVESAAAGLLMSGASVVSSRNQDRNYMRFNIANNPQLFKEELTKQLQNKEINQDQYNRAILETGRLNQLREQANSTMLNLVDGSTLLEDKDKQYEYFSLLLTRDDLLKRVDFNSLSDEDKQSYGKEVEKVQKQIDSYDNLAKKYAEMPKEEKESILSKLIQRQLDTVSSTNSPVVLSKNLKDLDDAIQIGEKTSKSSPTMISGRQQIREAVVARMEQLQSIEENGNTVFENQLLNTPIEAMGESMQISSAVRLEKLLLDNASMISPDVRKEVLKQIYTASSAAQEKIKQLSKSEQKKVISRELARVELLHPGTAFNNKRLKKLFDIDFTPEEKSEVIRETAVTIAREKEKIKEEEVLQTTEKDSIIDSLIKSFESEPLEIQVENKEGNLERVRNEERVTREKRAIFAIPRAKSKEQAKNRIKAIFKAKGATTEDINKALEDINSVFDNQEVTNPGEIYNSYLRFLDPNLLRSLPDKAIVEETTEEETPLSEEEVITETTPVSIEQEDTFGETPAVSNEVEETLNIPEVDPADQIVPETPIIVEDEFDGLEVVPVSTITSPELVHTSPTVFKSSNAPVQGAIMKTISKSLESYNLRLMDMFSFIRETLGESAMSSLENIYNNVTEVLKTQDKEALAKLKEEFLAVFSGSTFAPEQLNYIWNEQYVKGKPDASIPFQEVAYVTNSQFAIAYEGEEVVVTALNKSTGELFTYKAKVTGNINEANQLEVKTNKGALVYVKKSNIQPTRTLPINVRVNFNQINSILMTAVDRTSGEIAKFNSNGERDAQGDTQLNVFAPKENATMKEVRKNLASGQSISHTLPIHAGARINTASAYRQGKNSVYLTASVAGIDTDIQTVEPVLEQPTQPTDAKTDIERRRQEELDTNTSAGYGVIASDYLFTGGRGSMLSTDYLLQALTASFPFAGKQIDAIRNKYASKLGNISDDVNSKSYNDAIAEIRNAINTTYQNPEIESLFDKVLNNATGFVPREGNRVSSRLEALNEEYQNKVNEKYDAELAALEQPIEPEVTTNLNADELAILSFDVSTLENIESTSEPLDQNTEEEIDNAGSCKL